MYLLIPLGGLGLRFKDLGYTKPKPLINVLGKPIIFWLLDNLNIENKITEIIIPYNNELSNFNFEDLLIKNYPQYIFNFVCLKQNTNGATESVLYALNKIQLKNIPILILDGDNFYTTDIINIWQGDNKIFVFESHSQEPIYSYIDIDDNNNVVNIIEKEKISNLACTGAYGFKSALILKTFCEIIIREKIKSKNEYYMSTTINYMINNEVTFSFVIIDNNNYNCLGTPLHVRLFCNNYTKNNAVTQECHLNHLRICFDLDNTLVSYPQISKDYTSVKPIIKNINFLRYLKKCGHTIIIYTARRMKTSHSNIGIVNKDIGKITFETLEKFNIPYDEIYFGKPYADFYIDDLAVNAYDSLEKELGFYDSNIDPRDFNNITKNTIDIIKKKSCNALNGEIYYYNNIPNTIKDMFPIMFNYDIDEYKWYDIELIQGIPITKLYLCQELNIVQLENIMNSIDRIHKSSAVDLSININIYENYTKKLISRYQNFDYSIYIDSKLILDDILDKLKFYENHNFGKISVIHGDPVFSNILINKHGKLKFIDMRGKIGEQLTIYGDELYDWAKIYQSLIGYDEILETVILNVEYKNKLVKFFENKIIEIYNVDYLNYIKIITKSLLFSLIPLHHNNKCHQYYDLLHNLII